MLLQEKAQMYFDRAVPLTRPIETAQNAAIFLKKHQQILMKTGVFAEKGFKRASFDFNADQTTTALTTRTSDFKTLHDNSLMSTSRDFKELNKTNYLKRGCPRLLSLAQKRKTEELSNFLYGSSG